MVYSGAWGKLIHGVLKSKFSWHCPFNPENTVADKRRQYQGSGVKSYITFLGGPFSIPKDSITPVDAYAPFGPRTH